MSRYRESLSFALPGHFVRTAQLRGWSGLVNGTLLAAAAGEFHVLITGDRNMQYQQSASQLPMSIVVLIAPNWVFRSIVTGHSGHRDRCP
jgi:hypothetical protein